MDQKVFEFQEGTNYGTIQNSVEGIRRRGEGVFAGCSCETGNQFANLDSDCPRKVESGAQETEDLRLWKVEVSMWWIVMGTN
jgi:hypothetical protein